MLRMINANQTVTRGMHEYDIILIFLNNAASYKKKRLNVIITEQNPTF